MVYKNWGLLSSRGGVCGEFGEIRIGGKYFCFFGCDN